MPKQWNPSAVRKCGRCGQQADKLAYVYPDPGQDQEWVGRLVCADRCAPALRQQLLDRGILVAPKAAK